MSEKSGYEGDQEEFWHPDGSGRRVSREVFERETVTRQASAARDTILIDGDPVNRQRFEELFQTDQRQSLGLGAVVPAQHIPPDVINVINRDRAFVGLGPPIARRSPERWVSLPLIGFGQRQSALHGQVEIFPQFYEADIEVSQVVGIAQVAEAEFQRHGAASDVFLRFGGKVFCTLTRQQLRQRLGIVVEEVAS